MSGMLDITKVIVPIHCVQLVYEHLRKAGREGVEGVALWAGTHNSNVFEVKSTIIPKQKGYRIEDGLLYSVDGDELYQINQWLYENKMTLIAQIHSHPGEAYHSETDDRYPIVAVLGGISVVIPDFGFRRPDVKDWAVYRLMPSKQWVRQPQEAITALLQFV
jgi:hypothetical protein